MKEFLRTSVDITAKQAQFKADVDRIWPESKGN